ncbi:MAG: ATP-binding protein [Balneolaceae bacterium]|nr:ATP-binding protein [Balneolaceae bacterium]
MSFKITYELSSTYEELERVEHLLNELQEKLGFDDDFYARLMLTVSEAATNAVVHGNELDASKKATIVAEAENEVLTITTTDEGSGFVPEEVPNPLEEENLLKASGRGLFLMQEYADEADYLNDGRTLVLKFKL